MTSTLLTMTLKMLGHCQDSLPTGRIITCQLGLSHAKIFYHMPDHYESLLVIMPPFSIHSLYNAETTIEYKRETKFCTLVSSPPLGSHPHSLYPYLDLLVPTHIAIQGYFLVTIYLFALDIVNPWLGQLLTLCYTTCRTILTTSTITSNR